MREGDEWNELNERTEGKKTLISPSLRHGLGWDKFQGVVGRGARRLRRCVAFASARKGDGDGSDRAGPEMESCDWMLEKQRGRRKVPVWNRRPPAGTGGPIYPTSCSRSPRAATKVPPPSLLPVLLPGEAWGQKDNNSLMAKGSR